MLDRSATRFALTRLEPLELKGKPRPVEAWAVGPPSLARHRAEQPAAPPSALVGRAAELAALRAALAAVRRGDGRFAELAGEPGIGKTRLLEAVRHEAVGLRRLQATCEAHSGASPYAPWRELLIAADRRRLGGAARRGAARACAAPSASARPTCSPWLPLLAVPFGLARATTRPRWRSSRARSAPTRLHRAVIRLPRGVAPRAGRAR